MRATCATCTPYKPLDTPVDAPLPPGLSHRLPACRWACVWSPPTAAASAGSASGCCGARPARRSQRCVHLGGGLPRGCPPPPAPASAWHGLAAPPPVCPPVSHPFSRPAFPGRRRWGASSARAAATQRWRRRAPGGSPAARGAAPPHRGGGASAGPQNSCPAAAAPRSMLAPPLVDPSGARDGGPRRRGAVRRAAQAHPAGHQVCHPQAQGKRGPGAHAAAQLARRPHLPPPLAALLRPTAHLLSSLPAHSSGACNTFAPLATPF